MAVVANDDGGTREQVVDGKTGFLLRGRTEEELVNEAIDALTTLLRSPDLRRRMGAAGRERARSEFSMKEMGDSYSKFLSSFSPNRGFNSTDAEASLSLSGADARFLEEADDLHPVMGMGSA